MPIAPVPTLPGWHVRRASGLTHSSTLTMHGWDGHIHSPYIHEDVLPTLRLSISIVRGGWVSEWAGPASPSGPLVSEAQVAACRRVPLHDLSIKPFTIPAIRTTDTRPMKKGARQAGIGYIAPRGLCTQASSRLAPWPTRQSMVGMACLTLALAAVHSCQEGWAGTRAEGHSWPWHH